MTSVYHYRQSNCIIITDVARKVQPDGRKFIFMTITTGEAFSCLVFKRRTALDCGLFRAWFILGRKIAQLFSRPTFPKKLFRLNSFSFQFEYFLIFFEFFLSFSSSPFDLLKLQKLLFKNREILSWICTRTKFSYHERVIEVRRNQEMQ